MNVFKKFLRISAFAAVLFTVACNKDNSVSATDNLASPTATTTDELVVSGTGAGGNSVDSLKSPQDTSKHRGCWGGGKKHGLHPSQVKGDSIAFADLPAAAQTYLNANTDITTITRVVKITLADSTVNYVVRFSTGKHIHFDAAGAVVTVITDKHKFTEIKFTDLPAAAQTYLNANTTVANITIVVTITKPDGTVIYGVRLSDNTFYAFDSAGTLLPAPDRKGGKGKH